MLKTKKNCMSCFKTIQLSFLFRCTYEVYLEIHFDKTCSPFVTERLFIEVPGAPDAPDLWIKEQKDSVVTLQWSESRVYPTVPVSGYQVYIL